MRKSPRLDFQVVAIRRAVLVNVPDLVVTGWVRHQIETWMTRLERRPIVVWTAAAADTRVRRVQLANHHHHDGVELFVVYEVVEERLVGRFRRRPVGAVHLGVVEAILHDAPAFVEDLGAERFAIDLDVHRVGHLTCRGICGRLGHCRRRASSAAPTCRGLPSACGGRQVDWGRVQAGAGAEVQRAPVSRKGHAATAAPPAAAAPPRPRRRQPRLAAPAALASAGRSRR